MNDERDPVAGDAGAFFVRQTWGLLRLNLQVGMNDDSFVQSTFGALLAVHVLKLAATADPTPK